MLSDQDERPLDEELRAVLPEGHPAILKARKVEQAAASKSLRVIKNGDFPHWSLERWLAVCSFVILCTGSVFGLVYFAGGEVRVRADNDARQEKLLAELLVGLNAVRAEQQRVAIALAILSPRNLSPAGSERAVFPRDEQLHAGDRE
jgi:hypothetical protein